jgi:hypothetical protein
MSSLQFVAVRRPVLDRRDLGWDAKGILAMIASIKKMCWRREPGERVISDELGMSRRRVHQGLAQLREAGLLMSRNLGNGRGVQYTIGSGYAYADSTPSPLSGPAPSPLPPPTPSPLPGPAPSPLTGLDGGSGNLQDQEEEGRERADFLSPEALAFQEELEKIVGKAWNCQQVRHLGVVWVARIPVGFAVEVAQTTGKRDPPWKLGDRVLDEWGEMIDDARTLGRLRAAGVPGEMPAARVVRVRRWGRPEHVSYAFGGEGKETGA